jgi:hypothetical protein
VTTERSPDGWYYRHDGQPAGPVSAQELKDLLATGRLRPHQPVWQQGPHRLLFVHAATAAREAEEAGDPEPAPGLLPA